MSGKRLGEGVNIVVLNEDGEPETFMGGRYDANGEYRRGDEVPADLAKGLGDHVWEGYVKPERTRGARARAVLDGPGSDGGTGGVREQDPSENKGLGSGRSVPPMGGAGSGAEAWGEYAKSLGLEVEDGASRDDIVAKVKAGGFPTSNE